MCLDDVVGIVRKAPDRATHFYWLLCLMIQETVAPYALPNSTRSRRNFKHKWNGASGSRLTSLVGPESLKKKIRQEIAKAEAEAATPLGIDSVPISIADLFELNFFPPLLSKHCTDRAVVRLYTSSRSLHTILAPEVHDIQLKRRQKGLADCLLNHPGRDALQFLACMSYAFVRSCVKWDMQPLERFMAAMAFGPRGYHTHDVGYDTIEQIFGTDSDDEEGVEAPWFY